MRRTAAPRIRENVPPQALPGACIGGSAPVAGAGLPAGAAGYGTVVVKVSEVPGGMAT